MGVFISMSATISTAQAQSLTSVEDFVAPGLEAIIRAAMLRREPMATILSPTIDLSATPEGTAICIEQRVSASSDRSREALVWKTRALVFCVEDYLGVPLPHARAGNIG